MKMVVMKVALTYLILLVGMVGMVVMGVLVADDGSEEGRFKPLELLANFIISLEISLIILKVFQNFY